MVQKKITSAELRSLGIAGVIVAVVLIAGGSGSGTFQTHIIIYLLSAIFGILGIGSIVKPDSFGPILAALVNGLQGSGSTFSSKSRASSSSSTKNTYIYQDNRGAKGPIITRVGSEGDDNINTADNK